MMMGRNVNTNIKMFKKMLKIESLVQVGVFSYLLPQSLYGTDPIRHDAGEARPSEDGY